MRNSFVLPEESDLADLTRYLERALKLDNSGAVRFRAYGQVLAVYVAPITSDDVLERMSTVLGLRTLELSEAAEFDITISITDALKALKAEGSLEEFSLVKRLNKVEARPNTVVLEAELVDVAWAKLAPTRTGWELGGTFEQQILTEAARRGVAEITETLPASVGGPIAARVRAEIWGKAIDYKFPLPMGAAFVAAGLGFLTEGEIVDWYYSGDWVRLSSMHGHVLTNFAYDYVSLS